MARLTAARLRLYTVAVWRSDWPAVWRLALAQPLGQFTLASGGVRAAAFLDADRLAVLSDTGQVYLLRLGNQLSGSADGRSLALLAGAL